MIDSTQTGGSVPRVAPSRARTAARPGGRRRKGLGAIIVFAVAVPATLTSWPHLSDAARGWRDVVQTGGREAPLVRAPAGPLKILPPRGMADIAPDSVRQILDEGPSLDVALLAAAEEPILARPPEEAVAPAARATATERDSAPSVAPQAADIRPASQPAPQPDPPTEARLQLDPPPPMIRAAAYTKTPEDMARPRLVRAPQAAADPGSTYRIQVGALASLQEAEETWARLRGAHQDVLDALQPTIEEANTSTRTFFRVQAGDFRTLAEAQATCTQLNQQGAACVIVRR